MAQHLESSVLEARGWEEEEEEEEEEEAEVLACSPERGPWKDTPEVGRRLSTASTAADSDSEGEKIEALPESDSTVWVTSNNAGSARGRRLSARRRSALGTPRQERVTRWNSEGAVGPGAPALLPEHGRGRRRCKTVSFGGSSLVVAEVFQYDAALGGSDGDVPATGVEPWSGPGGAPICEEAAREEAEDLAQGQSDVERLQELVDRRRSRLSPSSTRRTESLPESVVLSPVGSSLWRRRVSASGA